MQPDRRRFGRQRCVSRRGGFRRILGGDPSAQARCHPAGYAIGIGGKLGVAFETVDPEADLVQAVEQHVDKARIEDDFLRSNRTEQILGGVDETGQRGRVEQPPTTLSGYGRPETLH